MDDEKEKKEVETQTTEETKTEEEKPTDDNSKDGEAPVGAEAPSMIDGAVLAAEELKKQNDRKEALLKREEEIESKKMFGGRSEAGQQATKKEPETDEHYVERFQKGEVNPFKDDGVK